MFVNFGLWLHLLSVLSDWWHHEKAKWFFVDLERFWELRRSSVFSFYEAVCLKFNSNHTVESSSHLTVRQNNAVCGHFSSIQVPAVRHNIYHPISVRSSRRHVLWCLHAFASFCYVRRSNDLEPMRARSPKTSPGDWVTAHLLWAACCDRNLLIGNINLRSEVPPLPLSVSPFRLFHFFSHPRSALTWRLNTTERWIIEKQISGTPVMQAALPPKQCGTNHCRSNQNCIFLQCCNKHPVKVEQKGRQPQLVTPRAQSLILHNYYFPRLSIRLLPRFNFGSCEFVVLMVVMGQHTCYTETGASFSPQAAGGWTCRPLLLDTSPGPPPDGETLLIFNQICILTICIIYAKMNSGKLSLCVACTLSSPGHFPPWSGGPLWARATDCTTTFCIPAPPRTLSLWKSDWETSDWTAKMGTAGQISARIMSMHCVFLNSSIFTNIFFCDLLSCGRHIVSCFKKQSKTKHRPTGAFIGLVRQSALWWFLFSFFSSKRTFFFVCSGHIKIFASYYCSKTLLPAPVTLECEWTHSYVSFM